MKSITGFGYYLLSDERHESLKSSDSNVPLELRAKNVTDADLANYLGKEY